MNFDLGPEELALQSSVRELCVRRFPIAAVRDTARTGVVDRGAWRALADAGVFALRLPEDAGGIGLGWTQAVVVFEELGRALVPGPLVASHLAAGLVDGAATGERIAGRLDPSPPAVVSHLASCDALLAVDAGGVYEVDPAALGAEAAGRPLDPLTPVHVVRDAFTGTRIADEHAAARMWLGGAALTAAQLTGIAAAVTDAAVEYAKAREQFGRPIGSFQAVKHMCADMAVETEVARAAVYAAGVLLDDEGSGDAPRAVAGAKLLAGKTAVANGKTCIQVHGGMGFTWEVDAHLYLKRAVVLATEFGTADEHAEAVAATL